MPKQPGVSLFLHPVSPQRVQQALYRGQEDVACQLLQRAYLQHQQSGRDFLSFLANEIAIPLQGSRSRKVFQSYGFLEQAAMQGYAAFTRLFLHYATECSGEKGFSIETNASGFPPLYYAKKGGHQDVVELLREYDRVEDRVKSTRESLRRWQQEKEALEATEASAYEKLEFTCTWLYDAITENHDSQLTAALLADLKAQREGEGDFNAILNSPVDESKRTLLCQALCCGSEGMENIVQLLIHGADPKYVAPWLKAGCVDDRSRQRIASLLTWAEQEALSRLQNQPPQPSMSEAVATALIERGAAKRV